MNKKEKILKQAKKLYAHKGYHETSMDEIAVASGMAKGTLYLYFENKEDIFVNVIFSIIQESDTWLDTARKLDKDLWSKIEYLIKKAITYYTENEEVFRILIAETPLKSILMKKRAKETKKIIKAKIIKLAAIFKLHRKEGVISDEITDTEAAQLCQIVIGGMVRGVLEGTVNRSSKNIQLLIRFLKNGIAQR